MKRLQEKASFLCAISTSFYELFFVGDVVFYERDGNDINRRLVY